LFSLAGAGLGFINVAYAGAVAPIVVNSTLDEAASSPGSTTCNSTPSDLCTLRAAIDAANNTSGGSVEILVPDGTYDLTILPAGSDNNLTGDLNIDNTHLSNVAIVGDVTNPGAVVIDGGGNSRVFNVQSESATSISGVTIQDGNTTNDGPLTSQYGGGGILVGGSLTLSHSVVTANGADGGGRGGGIDVIAGALTLDSVTVSDNGSPGTGDGGGVELETQGTPTDTIENSTVSDNAVGSGGYDGGGIDQADASTLDVTNTVISGNSGGGAGGGFFDNSATSDTFTDDTISNNTAGFGGGVFNDHGVNLTFTDSTISGNTANVDGGGFELEGNPSTVDITRSTISGNSTLAGTGGGIDNVQCDTLNLTNDTVAANTAVEGGGGLYGATNGGEGGACAAGQGVNFLFDTVAGNTAGTGGGDIDLQPSASLHLTDSIAAGGDPTCSVGASASLASGGYNLLGDASCGAPAGTDIVGQDPQLGALANNGGPTQTQLPADSAPEVGAIPDAACVGTGVGADQRGVARGAGAASSCTIGSVEVGQNFNGYRLVADEGGIFDFGLLFSGSLANNHLNAPIVGLANAPGPAGYLMVGGDGGVFALGGANFFGSLGGQAISSPIAAIAAPPSENGYWLVAQNGKIYNYGSVPALPALSPPVGAHIVGMASTTDGQGAWLVDQLGDVYAEGSAHYVGGLGGVHINKPIVGIAAAASGQGYILVASDGGTFAFGTQHFFGSVPGSLKPGQTLNAPVVGIAVTHSGNGYWEVGADGGVFTYGDAPFLGSMAGIRLNGPVVGIQHLGSVTAPG
jgi:CSLREA domain-containing protein